MAKTSAHLVGGDLTATSSLQSEPTAAAFAQPTGNSQHGVSGESGPTAQHVPVEFDVPGDFLADDALTLQGSRGGVRVPFDVTDTTGGDDLGAVIADAMRAKGARLNETEQLDTDQFESGNLDTDSFEAGNIESGRPGAGTLAEQELLGDLGLDGAGGEFDLVTPASGHDRTVPGSGHNSADAPGDTILGDTILGDTILGVPLDGSPDNPLDLPDTTPDNPLTSEMDPVIATAHTFDLDLDLDVDLEVDLGLDLDLGDLLGRGDRSADIELFDAGPDL